MKVQWQVNDPAITSIERHRLVDVLRRCPNIEQQSDLSRIGLLGEVEAEGAVVQCFGRIFQKLDLSTRRNAPPCRVKSRSERPTRYSKLGARFRPWDRQKAFRKSPRFARS